LSAEAPDVTAAVTKKIGPLPGWAWILVVAGGAWGYKIYRGRSSVAVAPTALSTDVSVAPGGFPAGTGNAGGGIGFGGGTGSVSGQPFGAPSVTTNAQWARSTADSMIAAGSDATATTNALSKYVAGSALTATDQAIVNQAISRYGSPPEGLLNVGGPPSFVSFLRDDLVGQIFGVTADGNRMWLTPEQYAAQGNPATTATVQNEFVRYEQNDNKIYGITGTGNRIWLSADQWAALGRPSNLLTQYSGHASGATPELTSGHKYVLVNGDTPGSVSMRFYGSSDTSVIMGANPGVTFSPGVVINVP
jgi:hypothetical protein